MKNDAGIFKARDKSYSPHYGSGEKRGPCRTKGHIYMGGKPAFDAFGNHTVNINRTCRRCGIEE